MSYKIIRMYCDESFNNRTIKRGLTLEEAQAHCKDKETSSTTCKMDANIRRTHQHGAWFDGYEEE